MDNGIKKGMFGGYKRKSVDAAVKDYESLLQNKEQEKTRLEGENTSVRENASELEAANRTLKDELRVKELELSRLEAKLQNLQTLYDQSVAARREYEQYLNRVGQVYMVACESAGGIVQRAENNAKDLLDSLADTAEQTQSKADEAIATMAEMRSRVARSLPGLLHTVNSAFEEIDLFLQTAQSIPQSFVKINELQQSAQKDMQFQVDSFHKATQSLVNETKKAEPAAPLKPASIPSPVPPVIRFPHSDKGTSGDLFAETPTRFIPEGGHKAIGQLADKKDPVDGSDYADALSVRPSSESAVIPPFETQVVADSSRPSLLEQEKLRRKQEEMSRAEGSAFSSSVSSSQEEKDAAPALDSPLPYSENKNEAKEPTAAASGQDYDTSSTNKRRPNIRELLTKYSQTNP